MSQSPRTVRFDYYELGDLDPSFHPKVKGAIDAARLWQKRRKHQIANGQVPNASLVLIARPVDHKSTGFGCGKTHIALSCLWSDRYVDLDGNPISPTGLFYKASRIIPELSQDRPVGDYFARGSQWSADGEFSSTFIPIVVLDDVGDEGVIPYVKTDADSQSAERIARYTKIIDYCYSKGISLILTTNLGIAELERHIGGRAMSRLSEMAGRGLIVDLTGVPDYRWKKGGR